MTLQDLGFNKISEEGIPLRKVISHLAELLLSIKTDTLFKRLKLSIKLKLLEA